MTDILDCDLGRKRAIYLKNLQWILQGKKDYYYFEGHKHILYKDDAFNKHVYWFAVINNIDKFRRLFPDDEFHFLLSKYELKEEIF